MPLYHSIEECVERNRKIQDRDMLIASRIWNIWKARRLEILAEKGEDQKEEENEEGENKLDREIRPEKEKKD